MRREATARNESWEESQARRIASDAGLAERLIYASKEATIELSDLQRAVEARKQEKRRHLRTAGA